MSCAVLDVWLSVPFHVSWLLIIYIVHVSMFVILSCPCRSTGFSEVIVVVGGCERMGGFNLPYTECYDPVTGEWKSLAKLQSSPSQNMLCVPSGMTFWSQVNMDICNNVSWMLNCFAGSGRKTWLGILPRVDAFPIETWSLGRKYQSPFSLLKNTSSLLFTSVPGRWICYLLMLVLRGGTFSF